MNEVKASKKVSSIRGKIHRKFIMEEIAHYIGTDVLVFLILLLTPLLFTQFRETGQLLRLNKESFSLSQHVTKEQDTTINDATTKDATSNEEAINDVREVYFNVLDQDFKTVDRIPLRPLFRFAGIFVGILAGIQVLDLLLSYRGDRREIGKIFSPLGDLALKADELNRLSFGEDKYQLIEEAIDRVQVSESGEKLTFGDKDLQGIEAAMNNLLVRMREQNMQQARFVNDASHELRTPIAVIQGYADMLDRWGKEDPKVLDESITAIRQEGEHMSRLVEQLLFLARGDAGRTELTKTAVSLNGFMQEIYEESLMIDEAHTYRFVPSENEITVKADRGLLKQAVRILIDNAAKYTAEKDEIILSTGFDEAPYIQVQDTGCGMQESDVGHIFERFYRSEEARQYKGTGLGLSIAKWIVDKHGAHFQVLSRQGLGTRIRVVLSEVKQDGV